MREHGANALDEEPEASFWRLALRQFKSPLVLILVFGAAVPATLREWLDAAIILAIVLGSCGLGFVQELRASNAVAQLRKRLALTVKARRDGALQTVEALQLVPGDIVQVSAGNLIPADGLVLEARDFLVTEASLTGESYPVEKQIAALHLLQSCLVYVNTLMLQRVLADPAWRARMTEADMRGLTPLVWGHVSPYGAFDLDMDHRLDLEIRQAA